MRQVYFRQRSNICIQGDIYTAQPLFLSLSGVWISRSYKNTSCSTVVAGVSDWPVHQGSMELNGKRCKIEATVHEKDSNFPLCIVELGISKSVPHGTSRSCGSAQGRRGWRRTHPLFQAPHGGRFTTIPLASGTSNIFSAFSVRVAISRLS